LAFLRPPLPAGLPKPGFLEIHLIERALGRFSSLFGCGTFWCGTNGRIRRPNKGGRLDPERVYSRRGPGSQQLYRLTTPPIQNKKKCGYYFITPNFSSIHLGDLVDLLAAASRRRGEGDCGRALSARRTILRSWLHSPRSDGSDMGAASGSAGALDDKRNCLYIGIPPKRRSTKMGSRMRDMLIACVLKRDGGSRRDETCG